MRVKRRTSHHHLSLRAVYVYECEHCGTTMQGSGHGGESFLRDMLPSITCPVCKKSAEPSTSDEPDRNDP